MTNVKMQILVTVLMILVMILELVTRQTPSPDDDELAKEARDLIEALRRYRHSPESEKPPQETVFDDPSVSNSTGVTAN